MIKNKSWIFIGSFLNKNLSGFISNVAILFTGSVISQSLVVFLTPVIARLFVPEHFGTVAVIVSLSTILSGISIFKYELALIVAKNESEVQSLTALSASILIIFSLFILLNCSILSYFFSDLTLLEIVGSWIFIIPIAVFLSGFFRIMNSLHMRKKSFKKIAASQVINSISVRGYRIISGLYFGSTVTHLIVGYLLGYLAAIVLLIKGLKKIEIKSIFKVNYIELKEIAFKYKKFPLFSTPTVLLLTTSRNLPVIMFSILFSQHNVGLLAMALRLIQIPLSMLRDSFRQVYMVKITELRNENKNKEVKESLKIITIVLAISSIIPLVVLIFWGEMLFSYILGVNWTQAGTYASILAPGFISFLIAAPSSALFVVYNRQELLLKIQLYRLILTIIVFLLSYFYSLVPKNTLILYSAVYIIFGIVIFSSAYKIVCFLENSPIKEKEIHLL